MIHHCSLPEGQHVIRQQTISTVSKAGLSSKGLKIPEPKKGHKTPSKTQHEKDGRSKCFMAA